MKRNVQLLKAQITRHFCSFQCVVWWRSVTKWLVTLANLTVLSASLDAQTPTPTPIPLFVGTLNTIPEAIAKCDGVTGAVINAKFITVPTSQSVATALALSGNSLFAAGFNSVSKFDATTGAVINPNLITGLDEVYGLAVFGNNIFVANEHSGTVGEYDATTGAVINASLITVSGQVFGLTVSGNNLFVTNGMGNGTKVSEYNAITGALINPNFITGLYEAEALAASGNNLFVVHTVPGFTSEHATVGEYNATTGAPINYNFIALDEDEPGLSLAVSGNSLFAVPVGPAVAEYNATTGALINAKFITGLDLGITIAVGPGTGAPPPGTPSPPVNFHEVTSKSQSKKLHPNHLHSVASIGVVHSLGRNHSLEH
jgi:hypothetical protein